MSRAIYPKISWRSAGRKVTSKSCSFVVVSLILSLPCTETWNYYSTDVFGGRLPEDQSVWLMCNWFSLPQNDQVNKQRIALRGKAWYETLRVQVQVQVRATNNSKGTGNAWWKFIAHMFCYIYISIYHSPKLIFLGCVCVVNNHGSAINVIRARVFVPLRSSHPESRYIGI